MRRWRTSAAWALIWATLAAAPAWAGLDWSIEKMMGREARAAIESQYRVVETPAVAGFVDRVGQRVAAVSPRKITYTFRIIESDEVNAMALPSGDVYVTTGLLEFASSQDDLAGVLGHELGHVAAKHSLRSFKKQFWAGLFLGVVEMPSGLRQAGELAATLYFLRYSRKDEAEADRFGVQMAFDSGYDPFALQGFMQRLGEAHKQRLSTVETWFTTHPEPERRVHRMGEYQQLDAERLASVVTIGSGYLDRRFPAQAVLRLRRAEALAPQDAQVQLLLAQANAAAGLTQEAARHAEMASALDPNLAEEAQGALQGPETGAAPGDPTPPVPDNVAQQAAESLKAVEASQQAVETASQALSKRMASIAETRKQLAERTERLAQELTDAARSGRTTSEQQTMLRRSASALNSIEGSLGRLGSVARARAQGAQEAQTAGEALAERLRAASSPAHKAQLVGWAERYLADVESRHTAGEEISQQAEQALAAAGSAIDHLNSAIDGLSRRSGLGWSSDRLTLDSARSDLDAADKEAKKAEDGARRASALQSEAVVKETVWGLDMDTLVLSWAQRRQMDAVVGTYLGAEAEAVRAAREEAGGLGSGALRLIASERSESEDESKAEAADVIRPEHQEGVDVLLALMRKDIKREMAAAKRVAEDPEAVEPAPPKETQPTEPAPTATKSEG